MKIYELTGVSNYRQETSKGYYAGNNSQKLVKYMNQFGFIPIGQGAMANVFEYKSNLNLVVKVYNTKDAGFRIFLEFCKLHSDSKFLPKFKGNSVKINNNLRMIRCERLTQISETAWNILINIGIFLFNFIDDANIIRKIDYLIAEKVLTDEDKELIDILFLLRQFKNENGYGKMLDIHRMNFMLRGNQIVIIDPISGYEKG